MTFIDAAAVRAFVQARHRAGALGCELVLANVHGLPLRVLRLVELDTVLEEVPAGEAFDILRVASQRLNLRLQELATRLAETGELPD